MDKLPDNQPVVPGGDPLEAAQRLAEQARDLQARGRDSSVELNLANSYLVLAATQDLRNLTVTLVDGLRRIESRLITIERNILP